mgnify:CR=1 FL=1
MKSIFTILKANIKHKKGAFKSIAALMAIITLSFSCTVSNNDNINRELLSSFENTDVGDILITLSEEELSDDIISELDTNENVSRWRKDELIAVNAPLRAKEEKFDVIIRLQTADEKLRVFSDSSDSFKQDFSLNDGEAVIGYSFAKMSGLEMGDIIEFETLEGVERFVIAGFAEDPIYGSSSISAEKIFITDNDFAKLKSKEADESSAPYKYLETVYMIHIFNSGKLTNSELSAKLNNNCGIVDKKLLYITKPELAQAITLYSSIGSKLLAIFVILLSITVIITIHNSISSSIEMEYVNLGILKSQGFTSRQIRLTFFLQYTIALSIGAAVGIIASVPIIKFLGKQFILFTGILTYGQTSVLKCLLTALLIIMICAVSVIISTSAVSRISPVKALNSGSGDVYFSSRLNVPIKQKPLMLLIALRQITSKLGAYFGTSVITALLVFFMMSITIMTDGLSFETLFGNMDNIKVSMILFNDFDRNDMDSVRNEISEINSNAEVIFTSHYDISVNDITYGADISDKIEFQAKIYDGRTPAYSNEIAITEIVADELGKTIGDTVSIHTDSGTEEYLITGFYQTTSEMGRTLIMNHAAAEKLEIPIQSALVIMPESTEEDIDKLLQALKDKFSHKLIAEKYETDASYLNIISTMDTLLSIVILMVFSISAVFAFVVVNMLCKKALLNEKRNIGIFKATGFSSDALRIQFALRFLITAIVGSAFGVCMSLLLSKKMFTVILRFIGITDFISEFTPANILVPSGIICLCFFVFAYISSADVKKIEVRELITE